MEMKNLINRVSALCIVSLALLCLGSCGIDDNEKNWGATKIYMPQAAIVNGGMDNFYYVPLSSSPTQNYIIDEETNTLKIALWVYRSGLHELEAYSVKVYVDHDATNQAVSNSLSAAAVLPANVYSLPEEIHVPQGEREATFFLSIDMDKLIESFENQNPARIVLVVGIKDPSKYELNEALSKTTIMISGPTFLPVPPIIKGGDFSSGSEQFWTKIRLDSEVYDESFTSIVDGALKLSFGPNPVNANVGFYQPIELTAGVTYKFSADFNSAGGVSSGRFFFCISQREPQEGEYYEENWGMYAMTDSWTSRNLQSPLSGKMPENCGWPDNGMARNGEFTPTVTGQYYFIISAVTWGSVLESIIIDNILIEEL